MSKSAMAFRVPLLPEAQTMILSACNKERLGKLRIIPGGTLGGMSDGSQLILRAAIKPTPSISQMQHTVTNSGEEIELSIHGRHDPIIVPRAVVVVEAMTALTLADLLLRNAVSRMNQIKQLYTEDKNV